MGFEPTTLGLGSRCSTTELRPLVYSRLYRPAPLRQPAGRVHPLMEYRVYGGPQLRHRIPFVSE